VAEVEATCALTPFGRNLAPPSRIALYLHGVPPGRIAEGVCPGLDCLFADNLAIGALPLKQVQRIVFSIFGIVRIKANVDPISD
jgi:hypothetical protein